ncbi:carboxylesterase/lipase family protein, partial [Streptomyces phytophilus]|uniref:carboxylesterase/lipase family protein n=1 Tax=Streptomyces phytophilus TaxID=722715 RepID=UPI0015F0B528
GRLDMTPYFGPGWVPGAEYLTVDVHTPAADGGGRPVMVFVHGGGFVTGSSRAALYDGGAFARDGVVLVTVDYGLGIPGFLDLAGAPANRGLLDVLAALTWVRDTVAAFGGDPGNVTLFGQSAGATLVGALLATPRARGLFHRAIVQSGSGTGAFTPEQAQRVTAAAAAALGVAPTAEAFAPVPDERLTAVLPALAGLDLRTSTALDPLAGLSPFAPVLPAQPADSLADGPAAGVDLLIGTNTEEGNLYLVPHGAFASTTAADVHALATRVHRDPEAALAAHRAARPDATPGELRSAVLGEALFAAGTKRLAQAHARISHGRTHLYSFAHRSTALDGRLGAAHTVELPFVFDIADAPWLHGSTRLLGPTPAPPGLAARIHGAWVDFATAGTPGWPPYDPRQPTAEILGTPPGSPRS